MLRWATIFFVIPLVVAIFGVGGFAASAANIATGLFVISLAAFLSTFFIKPPIEDDDFYDKELPN
jgi:uncharacterized membrane protein YtjA (UPF0391 family)